MPRKKKDPMAGVVPEIPRPDDVPLETPVQRIIMREAGDAAAVSETRTLRTVLEGGAVTIELKSEGPVGREPLRPSRVARAEPCQMAADVQVKENVLLDGRIPAVVLGVTAQGDLLLRTMNGPGGSALDFGCKPNRVYKLALAAGGPREKA